MREWQPDLAVVGLPYNVDGSDSDMTAAARGFAAELARALRVATSTWSMNAIRRWKPRRGCKAARESGLRRRRVAKPMSMRRQPA